MMKRGPSRVAGGSIEIRPLNGVGEATPEPKVTEASFRQLFSTTTMLICRSGTRMYSQKSCKTHWLRQQ